MNPVKTRVWERSLALVELAQLVDDRVRPSRRDLADQLARAASSVSASYLEGCGRKSAKDRPLLWLRERVGE
jgi:four helix bundle protein